MLIIIAGFIQHLAAQPLVFNNGQLIALKPGAVMIVKSNSLENNSGTISNAGTLIIEDDIINHDLMNGGGTSGTYRIAGDWVNNGTFLADSSEVVLEGNAQLITGSSITGFFNLTLTGNDIKKQTIDAIVNHRLDLTDRILNTDTNTLFVTNTDTGAIRRTSGFVSSESGGGLQRDMDIALSYLFPVGSIQPPQRYRPITVMPSTGNATAFKVRMANVDATTEGFDRDNKEALLCLVNPHFYHFIERISGNNPVELTFFYKPVDDGQWSTVAQYTGLPQWQDAGPPVANTSAGFSTLTLTSHNGFQTPAFALAKSQLSLDAYIDDTIAAGFTTSIQTSVSNATGNISYNWEPVAGLDCPTCASVTASPAQSTTYTVEAVDEFGCRGIDTVVITVFNYPYAFPNAFVPEGKNNIFNIIKQGDLVELIEMKIFNRWGKMVYEGIDGWDGYYNGKLQPVDNYIYHAVIRLPDGTLKTEVGEFTLIW